MKSQRASEILREAVTRASDRGRGVATPRLTRLSSDRAVELAVGNVSKLPVRTGAPPLQDADGNLIFLWGYSAFGGPDVWG